MVASPVRRVFMAYDVSVEVGQGPMGEMNYVVFQCGMLTQHLADRAPSGPTSLYGVVTMLRSQEIRQALMVEEFQDDRRRWDTDRSGSA